LCYILKKAEKRKQKEEIRKEKEAERRKAALEKANARRIAKESMELIEDEQLELMELAAASKGLPSIIQIDLDTLQNLESFRGEQFLIFFLTDIALFGSRKLQCLSGITKKKAVLPTLVL
jgi:hypothetical protein